MLAENERGKLIDQFLSGTMDAGELHKFTDMLDNDPQLRYELEQKSGVDALLHSAGNATSDNQHFIIALDKVLGKPVLNRTKKNVLVGYWVQLYAVAASLLLAVAGVYIVNMRKDASFHRQAVSVSTTSCHGGKSIYNLSDGSLFLSEEGSKVRVLPGKGNDVNVVLSQGNVCFDVPDTALHTITVATPHAAVILEKRAVTRVVVTELETEVAVLEGNAEVIHRYNRDQLRELATGGTILADFEAVQVAQNLSPEVCGNRTNLFKAYISWVQKQARG